MANRRRGDPESPLRRRPPWTGCAVQGRAPSEWTSHAIPVPSGDSPLEVGLAILECLVKDHHAVVTATDIAPDGTGTYTVRIPMLPIQS
jgi:hypothetical protein